MLRVILFILPALLFPACAVFNPPPKTDNATADIRLNQVGFYPDAPKKAVVAVAGAGDRFAVVSEADGKKVFEGKLSQTLTWPLAGETVRIADFSGLRMPGRYALYVEGAGYSYPFSIADNILNAPLRAAVKSFYYQRAGFALEEKYAGQWARPAGHPDQEVMFHPSTGRSGMTVSNKGWYDAGDYGKYVVNGAFSLGQMLFLHEQYPEILPDGALHIPESGNGVSDLLDELKYEMDWLLQMQDEDGGAFFKLTTLKFGGMKLPHELKLQRYIIGKGTAPSLNLAAVAAKMSRAYAKIDPEYAQTCRQAALRAWEWAVAHPDRPYKNPEDVKTGEYSDADFSGEFFWAAAELYVATKNEKYLPYLEKNMSDFEFRENESWANFTNFLGAFTLLNHAPELPLTAGVRNKLLKTAEILAAQTAGNDYFQPVDAFFWGSNSDVLNAAMILATAYRMDPKPVFLTATRETTDYVFGKNANAQCFLTGYGNRSPMHIHHRPSAADGIDAPVPGFVVGGPNYGKQDAPAVVYPENAPPMKCWVDVQPSFASNEVCLNWNAPLVYVLGFLEAQGKR